METITDLPGYRITEQLYAGSRTLVYRGVRESIGLQSSSNCCETNTPASANYFNSSTNIPLHKSQPPQYC